jgi:hypothetical protein
VDLSSLADVGKIAGGVVAAMTVLKAVASWWRTGPGRRGVWARGFDKLAWQVRPAYVEELFGAPAFEIQAHALALGPGEDENLEEVRWVDLTLTERVWPLADDGFLTTWSDESGLVAHALTTTSRRFRPKIRVGAAWRSNGAHCTVRLGRTRLAEVSDALQADHPQDVISWKGARRFEYYETYYFGNPGLYQTFACGVSGAGLLAGAAGAMDRLGSDGSAFLWGTEIDTLPEDRRTELADFRDHAVINSVMVLGSRPMRILPDRPRCGPDHDLVRTLEGKPGLIDRYRHRRWLRELEGRPSGRRLPGLPRPRGGLAETDTVKAAPPRTGS